MHRTVSQDVLALLLLPSSLPCMRLMMHSLSYLSEQQKCLEACAASLSISATMHEQRHTAHFLHSHIITKTTKTLSGQTFSTIVDTYTIRASPLVSPKLLLCERKPGSTRLHVNGKRIFEVMDWERLLAAVAAHSSHFINAVTLERQKRVAMTLWRPGTNNEYKIIRHLFGVRLSIVRAFGHEVCEAIVTMLGYRYIRIPQGNGIQQVVDGFMSKWRRYPSARFKEND